MIQPDCKAIGLLTPTEAQQNVKFAPFTRIREQPIWALIATTCKKKFLSSQSAIADTLESVKQIITPKPIPQVN